MIYINADKKRTMFLKNLILYEETPANRKTSKHEWNSLPWAIQTNTEYN